MGRALADEVNQKIIAFGDESRDWFAKVNQREKVRVFRDVSAKDVDRMRQLVAGWTLDHVSTMCLSFRYLSGNHVKVFAESFGQSLLGFGTTEFWDSFDKSNAERTKYFDAKGFLAISVAKPFGKRIMSSLGADDLTIGTFIDEYGIFCAFYLLRVWGWTSNTFADNDSVTFFAREFKALTAEWEELCDLWGE